MITCSICGEKIAEGSRTCSVCGSSVEDFLPSGTGLTTPTTPSKVELPRELPPGGSCCPACGKVYAADYADLFCVCGTMLVKDLAAAAVVEAPPMAPILEEPPIALVEEIPPMAPILEEAPPLAPFIEEPPPVVIEPAAAEETPDVKKRAVKPPSGTPCLALYGPDKQPLHYFPLTKDAMMIGRLDAVAGNFPDIDLDEWFERAIIRRISRQHALILRTRATGAFALRPLPGNTGTQLEAQMLAPAQDYPLQPGHRIILGGVIRLKFEIACLS
ncbi:MAG: FHA domain-containing protein [Planctomycetes bacterium]|nr:FHA domain-containing protein [Planctomycetota bacterium]